MALTAQFSSLTRPNRRLEVKARGMFAGVRDVMTSHAEQTIKKLMRQPAPTDNYIRTGQLRMQWAANIGDRPYETSRGFIVEITNDAANIPQTGIVGRKQPATGVPFGKRYAIFVHGSADGSIRQASMHMGRWTPLVEAIDRPGYRQKIRKA